MKVLNPINDIFYPLGTESNNLHATKNLVNSKLIASLDLFWFEN